MFLVMHHGTYDTYPIGVYSSLDRAKRVATGCMVARVEECKDSGSPSYSNPWPYYESFRIYYMPANQTKCVLVGQVQYRSVVGADEGKIGYHCVKKRVGKQPPKDNATRLAYDLLNGDPIALDMMRDMLKT